ncbi:MAG: T9SS type A sorting domain-containing protein, partial [Prevotella sp.]|nr:T9SS type A sorting domain-containing protein [Prevotella sp.]
TSIDGTASKTKATLYQNAPNPFTAQTEIRFSLPDDAPQAYIYVFDMTGKMQKQIPVNPSQQSVTINGYELSAGIYLYSLVVGGQEIDTKRMILSK